MCDICLQTLSPAYTLNIGSRIYIDSNILVRQRYAATVKSFYNTDVIVNNMSNVHAVATNVNSWISNITNGHIQNIISDGESISSKWNLSRFQLNRQKRESTKNSCKIY